MACLGRRGEAFIERRLVDAYVRLIASISPHPRGPCRGRRAFTNARGQIAFAAYVNSAVALPLFPPKLLDFSIASAIVFILKEFIKKQHRRATARQGLWGLRGGDEQPKNFVNCDMGGRGAERS